MRRSDFIFRYRVRNWPKYNRMLIARGSLTLWVDEQAVSAWCRSGGPRGRDCPRIAPPRIAPRPCSRPWLSPDRPEAVAVPGSPGSWLSPDRPAPDRPEAVAVPGSTPTPFATRVGIRRGHRVARPGRVLPRTPSRDSRPWWE